MIDFGPLFRALLEAAVWGTAIYLLMVGRKGPYVWAWGVASVVGAGLLGAMMPQPSYVLERWSLPSVAAPMGGALCSVAVGLANRSRLWPHWLGIGSSIAAFYFASLLLRLVLSFVLQTE